MDCIITAGGLPKPESPMYELTGGGPKVLLDMEGRTMLERVVDALQGSEQIEDIVVVGLGSDMGMSFKRPVIHLTDQGSLAGNAVFGMEHLVKLKPNSGAVLFCSGDVPLITPKIVDNFLAQCYPYDKGIYYSFVTKEVMEKRFPNSNRTYVKLNGMEVAGGDMVMGQASIAISHREWWHSLTQMRKHAWKMARFIGLRMMLKFLFRRLNFADIEAKAEEILEQPSAVILSPDAELAMDADKPNQVELVRNDLRRNVA